ncbi:hypothetical protein AAE478_006238 [Parahypoxylon ruwenzoriense]
MADKIIQVAVESLRNEIMSEMKTLLDVKTRELRDQFNAEIQKLNQDPETRCRERGTTTRKTLQCARIQVNTVIQQIQLSRPAAAAGADEETRHRPALPNPPLLEGPVRFPAWLH